MALDAGLSARARAGVASANASIATMSANVPREPRELRTR